ncbi:MAG: IdeS/Mac family cysteine endopeptidase [Treponema sp.]
MKILRLTACAVCIAFLLLSCKANYSPRIPVTGITLSPDLPTQPISLVSGATCSVNARATPENAADKKLLYSSNAQDIASVDDKGLITAKKAGSATITIMAKAAPTVRKTITIIVKQKTEETQPAPVKIDDIAYTAPPSNVLYVNDTFSFKAAVKPDNTTEDKTLVYSTTTPDNIEILNAETGTVRAKQAGSATVIITAKASPTVTKTITIIVKQKTEQTQPAPAPAPVKIDDIAYTAPPSNMLYVNDTFSFKAAVKPDNTTEDKTLVYSTTAPDLIEILNAETGTVRAKQAGSATVIITAKACPTVRKTITITVKQKTEETQPVPPSAPITINDIDYTVPASNMLYVNDTFSFTAAVKPDNTTEDKTLVYSTTTPDNIEILNEEKGTVKAKKAGSATIIITAKAAPTVRKTIELTIKQKPSIRYESQTAVMLNSDAAEYTFTVKTIDGKLDYEPRLTSPKLPWITGTPKISSRTNPDTDVISLICEKNKTVWDRRAYIKFWNNTEKTYVKDSKGNDLTVSIIQKRNENPVIHYKWVDGIGEPDEADKEKVAIKQDGVATGENYAQSFVFKWKETTKTKFYNARKLYTLQYSGQPSDYYLIKELNGETLNKQGHDGSQCWAKTASNMLHWWFEQNKDMITLYKEKTAIAPDRLPLYEHTYIRGLQDTEEGKKSTIANNFRAYTHNQPQGGYIEDGLTWYLYKRPNGKKLSKTHQFALFDDVFTFDTKPITIERCETKAEFEQIMNTAFEKKRAIGLFWQGGKGQKQYKHAVTCWGAAYDEDDNIVCLYIAESNLKEPVLYPYGVRYLGDIYNEPEKNQAYMFNYDLSKPENIYIDSITTLDKGEEQWKEWCKKHP